MMLNVLHDVTGTSCWCHALPDPMHNFHVVYALEKATGSYISFFFYSEVLGINNRFECVLSNSPWVSYSNNTHDRQIYIGKPVLKHVTVSMNKKAKKVYQKGFLKTVIKAGIIPRIVNSFQLRELGVQNTTAMYPWNVILSLLHQCILGLSLMSSKIHQLFFPALPKKLPSIFFNSHTVPIILSLLLQVIARHNWNNTCILPFKNETHHHRPNYNYNNLRYLWNQFIKVHQNHLYSIDINTEVTLIKQSHQDTLIEQSDWLFPIIHLFL